MQAAIGVFLGNRNHQAQICLDHLLLGARAIPLATAHRGIHPPELRDRQPRVVGDGADLRPHIGHLRVILGGERLPALAGQGGHHLHPVRIKLVAAIPRQKIVARHLAALGKAQQLAFQPVQPLRQLLELRHQLLDAVIVQPHLLHARHQLLADLLVGLLRAQVHLLARGQRLQPLGLHLVQLLVEVLDLLEGFQNFRLQLLLQRGERKPGPLAFLAILRLVGRRHKRHRRRITVAGLGSTVTRHGGLSCRLGLHRGAGPLGGFQIDDVAQQHAAGLQRVMPVDDGAEGQRAFAKPADHHIAAGLDPLGDRDLALAGEQLHAAHLAQIHPHRIIGTAQALLIHIAAGFGGLVRLALGLLRLGNDLAILVVFVLDNLDAHFAEHGHDILDLLGGHLFGRQNRVQLFERDIPALAPLGDQPLDRG